jgi:mannose-6-phosphate isomerase-like protein (cupin superfamily)
MATPVIPFAMQPGAGTPLETPSADWITIKAHTLNTNGSMSVFEIASQPYSGPGLHTHLREDELWWVLEGEYRFKAGDAAFRVSQGGMAFGPRGMPHAFQNIGDTVGRLLAITTPSGAERFFEQFAEQLPGPVNHNTIADLGLANWIEFIGPPLAISDPL